MKTRNQKILLQPQKHVRVNEIRLKLLIIPPLYLRPCYYNPNMEKISFTKRHGWCYYTT